MLIAGDGDIDAPITCIPGLETVMCRKDLSGMSSRGVEKPGSPLMLRETLSTTKASFSRYTQYP